MEILAILNSQYYIKWPSIVAQEKNDACTREPSQSTEKKKGEIK